MTPGAHVVIFLTALIENWLGVGEGVSALAVDVMTCEEVDEDKVDEIVGGEAGEEFIKTPPMRPGSRGVPGDEV